MSRLPPGCDLRWLGRGESPAGCRAIFASGANRAAVSTACERSVNSPQDDQCRPFMTNRAVDSRGDVPAGHDSFRRTPTLATNHPESTRMLPLVLPRIYRRTEAEARSTWCQSASNARELVSPRRPPRLKIEIQGQRSQPWSTLTNGSNSSVPAARNEKVVSSILTGGSTKNLRSDQRSRRADVVEPGFTNRWGLPARLVLRDRRLQGPGDLGQAELTLDVVGWLLARRRIGRRPRRMARSAPVRAGPAAGENTSRRHGKQI